MSLSAGELRDRITVQRRVNAQDPVTGETRVTWIDQWTNIPANIDDMSARDRFASQAIQPEVTTRIVIRYLPGLTSEDRIVDAVGGDVYTIEGPPIRDKDSRREYMTLTVSLGVADGE